LRSRDIIRIHNLKIADHFDSCAILGQRSNRISLTKGNSMDTRKLSLFVAGVTLGLMLAACGGAPTAAVTPEATEALPLAPTEAATEANGNPYVPVTEEVCLTIKESAEAAVGVTFTMEPVSGFMDPITGETGDGCTLTAQSTGAQFSDPYAALDPLVKGMVGWEEDASQQAGGPTGAATALRRDMGLMLISVSWDPAPEVQCPADQPISACDVKPEQQIYTIQIQTAMK
jgi:hypothetical protein